MRTMPQIVAKCDALERQYSERDARMQTVAAIRRGDYTSFTSDLFPETWPRPIVANFIDTAARDISEVLAPLPTITAATSTFVNDKARARADKRNKIVQSYLTVSRFETQMYSGADRYITYGFLPFRVEPDFETKRPKLIAEDPMGGYPEFDQWGRTVSYTKRWQKSELELCALFPEMANQITYREGTGLNRMPSADQKITVVKYHDADQTVMFLPERKNLILAWQPNPLGKCLVRVAKRPSLDGNLYGQFDDVLWVQLARAKFALLALEAAEKSVRAPLAVPLDVQDVAFGPDSVLRSATPRDIGKVDIKVPHEAFMVEQVLQEEQRLGARYPESRSGSMDASVITGRGVQALSSGFDSQIRAAQQVFAETLVEVLGLALEMDEKLWPSDTKTIWGQRNGTPYEVTYQPAKDINGDYKVNVTYGLMAGLDPNRALVFVLQALSAELVSKDFARRNLPAEMNVSEEEQMIDVERLRGAVAQAIEAYAQAIPALAEGGGDPSAVLVKMSQVIQARQTGTPIEDAITLAFAPPPSEESPGSELPGDEGAAEGQTAGGGQTTGGLMESGLMRGVAPGQAGMPPGGRPTLQELLAGLNARGAPNLSASVSRRIPG